MGFKAEADAYMDFIMERFVRSRGPDGALPIMFTIRGDTDIPEITLDHLEGYRNSQPVRIGNGAAFHKQFDIYGELMDAIYLYNKFGKPVPWDVWCAVREILGELYHLLLRYTVKTNGLVFRLCIDNSRGYVSLFSFESVPISDKV